MASSLKRTYLKQYIRRKPGYLIGRCLKHLILGSWWMLYSDIMPSRLYFEIYAILQWKYDNNITKLSKDRCFNRVEIFSRCRTPLRPSTRLYHLLKVYIQLLICILRLVNYSSVYFTLKRCFIVSGKVVPKHLSELRNRC